MFTIIPFFIAGFFYPFWPWGMVAALAIMPVIMLGHASHFSRIWEEDKALLIQTTVQSIVGSVLMNGAAMLLSNGIRWLIGRW